MAFPSSGAVSQKVTYGWKSEQTFGKQETRAKYQSSPGMGGRGDIFGKSTSSSRRAKLLLVTLWGKACSARLPSPSGLPSEEPGSLDPHA